MHVFLIMFLAVFPRVVSAETVANEIPLFAGVIKNQAQMAADNRFIDEATRAAGSRAEALKQSVAAGWKAIEKGDLSLAIRRFNQGYLLSPSDYRVYWGLGTIMGMKGDVDRSVELFHKGVGHNRTDQRFLADYAFSLQQSAIAHAQREQIDPRPKLMQAKQILDEAIKINRQTSLPHARLAVIYFYQGDCAASHAEVALAEKYGGEGLDPRFITDLGRRCVSHNQQ